MTLTRLPCLSRPSRLSPDRRARAGFSFIEILVVMAIIAVLVGIGIGIYTIVMKKTPEIKAKNLMMKIRSGVDLFKGKYRALPPTDFSNMGTALGMQMKLGKATPTNTSNAGIESLYQALHAPGLSFDISDDERCNTDEDALDKPFGTMTDATLFEIKDPWGNPLVYFTEGDYATADKQPPTYLKGDDAHSAVNPRPWKSTNGTGFAQPSGFQVFSMGPDGEPNTDDDVKSWE